jgi:hypothetical protein
MDDRARMLGQLQAIKEREHWTATRMGQPGCAVRLAAADNVAALEWALSELSPKDQPL